MKKNVLSIAVLGAAFVLLPEMASADVMGSLHSIKGAIGRIFPIIGMLGLLFAGLSFFTGNQNAMSHLKLALIGAAIGFGAEPIISFIDSLVN